MRTRWPAMAGWRPVDVVQAELRVLRQQAAVHEQVAADLEHYRMPREEPACSVSCGSVTAPQLSSGT